MPPLLIAIEPGLTHALQNGIAAPTLQLGVGHWTEAVERFGQAWSGETLLIGNSAPERLVGIDRFHPTAEALVDRKRSLWLQARSRFVRLVDPLLAGEVGSRLVQDEWEGTTSPALLSLLLDEVRTHRETTILIPTATPVTAETVIRNANVLKEATGQGGSLRLRIRFSSQGHERRGLHPSYFARQLKRWSDRAGSVDLKFGIEVESMANRYSEESGLDVAWVPWPHEAQSCLTASTPPTPVAPHIYLYASRPEQGSESAPRIVASIQHEIREPLRFTVQLGRQALAKSPTLIHAFAQMGQVTLSGSGLLPSALHAQFADAAVVILPYDVRKYRGRGSALMWGALDHGVPLIAPAGTGFGDDIARHGIGYTYGNLREISALVRRVLDERAALSSAIERYQLHRATAVRAYFGEHALA